MSEQTQVQQGMKPSQSTLDLFEELKVETKDELLHHGNVYHAGHEYNQTAEEKQKHDLSPRSSHLMVFLIFDEIIFRLISWILFLIKKERPPQLHQKVNK